MNSSADVTRVSAGPAGEEEGLLLTVLVELAICVTFIIGTVLNTVIVIIFCKKRRGLRSVSDRLVFNLCLTNLAWLMAAAPATLLDCALQLDLAQAERLCLVMSVGSSSLAGVMLAATLLVSSDQYLAIVAPLHYHSTITTSRVRAATALAWMLPPLLSLPLATDPHPAARACRTPGPALPSLPAGTALLLLCLAPLAAIGLMQVRILSSARGNSVRTRRASVCSAASHLSLQSQHSLSRSRTSLASAVRRKLSGAAGPLGGEEARAARLTASLLVLLAACWTPHSAGLMLAAIPASARPAWLPGTALALLHCYAAGGQLIIC